MSDETRKELTNLLANLEDVKKLQIAMDSVKATKALADLQATYSFLKSEPSKGLLGLDSVGFLGKSTFFDSETDRRLSAIQAEAAQLKKQLADQQKALLTAKDDAAKRDKITADLEKKYGELLEKERLGHLLTRVTEDAQEKILSDKEFRALFRQEHPCEAFVMSIDIRRSTELMLKSREPKLFAEFIITLAAKLRECVLSNYGVFDKFTGDGILAFFPDFFAGESAGLRVISAAIECHRAFQEHYSKHRHVFLSVLKDTGLGIGVDYGKVHLVEVGREITIVGVPVVYACRLGGAKAGVTLVNQPAFEVLQSRHQCFDFEETELNFKNEGATLAYAVKRNNKLEDAVAPPWMAKPHAGAADTC